MTDAEATSAALAEIGQLYAVGQDSLVFVVSAQGEAQVPKLPLDCSDEELVRRIRVFTGHAAEIGRTLTVVVIYGDRFYGAVAVDAPPEVLERVMVERVLEPWLPEVAGLGSHGLVTMGPADGRSTGWAPTPAPRTREEAMRNLL